MQMTPDPHGAYIFVDVWVDTWRLVPTSDPDNPLIISVVERRNRHQYQSVVSPTVTVAETEDDGYGHGV